MRAEKIITMIIVVVVVVVIVVVVVVVVVVGSAEHVVEFVIKEKDFENSRIFCCITQDKKGITIHNPPWTSMPIPNCKF